ERTARLTAPQEYQHDLNDPQTCGCIYPRPSCPSILASKRRRCGADSRQRGGRVMQAEIKGTTMPILEVSLGQGEAVVSTHGELAWMTQHIQMSQRMNTGGGGGGLMQGLKRAIGGGGIFLTHYEGPGAITFAAKVPGHIVPVDITPGQAYYVHR